MSATPNRVYLARLAGLPVFDPQGDQVGKIRDIVVALRPGTQAPRALGLVVEVFGRRRVFVPMTRVTNIDAGQVISTGVVNMRKFQQRPTETLVLGEMFDRRVTITETGAEAVVFDLAVEPNRTHDWVVSKVAVQERAKRFGRRGQTHVLDWDEVSGLAGVEERQGAAHMLAAFDAMRPADLAGVIHDLSAKRRSEIAAALDDERLADVLEELPEEDQVEILGQLGTERAADVLEEMSPDDAADLIAELPPEVAEHLLRAMEPGEADNVRRLLTYEERTAGGLMTTEPVILPPTATVADALASVRNEELPPSLAAMVFVVRPPTDVPTGKLLGLAHFQRLLREPPSTLVSAVVVTDLEPLHPDASLEDVAAHMATYNLVASPVADDDGRLLGVVTVDDVIDHLLPDDWRDRASSPASRSASEVSRGA
ncbi:MAG TPA: CBS domain-containing protein [Nocardioidaceae bacterium]|nr:CBS domain-containing protein [Nocardioidaceae bacterium]